MPRSRRNRRLTMLMAGLIPWASHALEIDVQGELMQTTSPSETCINLAGEYPGFRIENSVAQKKARICQQGSANNLLAITDANFVATQDNVEIKVRFRHEFAPGINGLLVGRAGLDGFFATATGTQAPAGGRVELHGFLNQGSNDDLIEEAVSHTVASSTDLESAVFELHTKKSYLVAGARALRGELSITLPKAGDQMAVFRGIWVILDPPYTRGRLDDEEFE